MAIKLCAVCKTFEATQKHHLCYDPELTIDICKHCHIIIHKHGVGIGKYDYEEANRKKFRNLLKYHKKWRFNGDKIITQNEAQKIFELLDQEAMYRLTPIIP